MIVIINSINDYYRYLPLLFVNGHIIVNGNDDDNDSNDGDNDDVIVLSTIIFNIIISLFITFVILVKFIVTKYYNIN